MDTFTRKKTGKLQEKKRQISEKRKGYIYAKKIDIYERETKKCPRKKPDKLTRKKRIHLCGKN